MYNSSSEAHGIRHRGLLGRGKQYQEWISLPPLPSRLPGSSVGWQDTCQMCRSHTERTALVGPDLVAPRLMVKYKTQTNPKGNEEGPTLAIQHCRTGLSVFVYPVTFKLEKNPVITTKLLHSLLCIALLLYLHAACAC